MHLPLIKIEGHVCPNTTILTDSVLTCNPAAMTLSAANVTVVAGGCASVASLTVKFVDFPWRSALRWEPQPQRGAGAPGARFGHVMAEDGAGGAVVHGGLGNEGLLTDVFRFLPQLGEWGELATSEATPGARPAARTEHAGAVVDGALVVVGGWNAGLGLQLGEAPGESPANATDVPTLGGDAEVQRRARPRPPAHRRRNAERRTRHAQVAATLLGGTHVLRLDTGEWLDAAPPGDAPSPRRGAAAARLSGPGGAGEALLLFGGHESLEQGADALSSAAASLVPNVLHVLDAATLRCAAPLAPRPPGCSGHGGRDR